MSHNRHRNGQIFLEQSQYDEIQNHHGTLHSEARERMI